MEGQGMKEHQVVSLSQQLESQLDLETRQYFKIKCLRTFFSNA